MMNIIAILMVCTTFMRDTYWDLVERFPKYHLPFIHTIGSGPTVPRVAVTQPPPPPVHFVTYTAANAAPSIIPNNDSTFEYTYTDTQKAYLNFDEPHAETFTPPETVTFQETQWAENLALVLAVLLGLLALSLVYRYRLNLFAILSNTLEPAHPLVTKTPYGLEIVHMATEFFIDHTRVLVHDPSWVTCIQAESAESIENRELRSRVGKLERTVADTKAANDEEIYQLKSEKGVLQSELDKERTLIYLRDFSPFLQPREAQTSQQPDDQCPESAPDGEPAEQDQPKAGRLNLREKLWTKDRNEKLQEDVKQLLKRIDRLQDEKSQQHKNLNRLRHRMRKVMVLSTKPKILVKVSSARKREIRRANLAHQRQIDALAAENRKLKSSEQSKDARILELEAMLSRKSKPAVRTRQKVTKEMIQESEQYQKAISERDKRLKESDEAKNALEASVKDERKAKIGLESILVTKSNEIEALKQKIDEYERKNTLGPDPYITPDTSAKPAEPADTVSGNTSTQVTAADQSDVPDDSTAQGSCSVGSQPQQASHPETPVGNTPLPSTDGQQQQDEPADTVSADPSSQGTGADQNDMPNNFPALGFSNAPTLARMSPSNASEVQDNEAATVSMEETPEDAGADPMDFQEASGDEHSGEVPSNDELMPDAPTPASMQPPNASSPAPQTQAPLYSGPPASLTGAPSDDNVPPSSNLTAAGSVQSSSSMSNQGSPGQAGRLFSLAVDNSIMDLSSTDKAGPSFRKSRKGKGLARGVKETRSTGGSVVAVTNKYCPKCTWMPISVTDSTCALCAMPPQAFQAALPSQSSSAANTPPSTSANEQSASSASSQNTSSAKVPERPQTGASGVADSGEKTLDPSLSGNGEKVETSSEAEDEASSDEEEEAGDPFGGYAKHQKKIANAPGSGSGSHSHVDPQEEFCGQCLLECRLFAEGLCTKCWDYNRQHNNVS